MIVVVLLIALIPNTAVAVAPEPLDANQRGRGLFWQFDSDDPVEFRRTDLTSANGAQATLVIRGRRDFEQTFSGSIQHRDDTSLVLALEKVQDRPASGLLYVVSGTAGAIRTMAGHGTMDGKPFAMQFTADRPLLLNQLKAGTGTHVQGKTKNHLQYIGVMGNTRNEADIVFMLDNGQVRWLRAKVNRPSKDRMVFEAQRSGAGKASGELIAEYDLLSGIKSLNGDIAVNGITTAVQFRSSEQPATANIEK